MKRLVARMDRTARFSARAIWQGVIDFYHSDNLTYAGSIAYYSLLSLFPFLLLVLSILSKVKIGHGGEPLLLIATTAMPSKFDFLITHIQELEKTPLELSVAGVLISLWASMGVFSAVTSAIDHAWGVDRPRGFWTHQLVAFIMLIAAGLLLIVGLLLMGADAAAETSWFSNLVARVPALGQFGSLIYRNAPVPIFIGVIGLIYYFVPNARVRPGDVWVGALVAGFLWRLAYKGFAWYVSDLQRFSVHGSVAAVVVFLLWVYLSAVILLYGAEVSAAYARFRKRLPVTAPAAEARTTPAATLPSAPQ